MSLISGKVGYNPRAMPAAPMRIFLATLVTLALSWVIPGHQRAHAMEPTSEVDHHDHAGGGEDHDESHCSICLFSAKLTTPDALRSAIPTLELLELTPARSTLIIEPLHFIRTFYGRGPPPIV